LAVKTFKSAWTRIIDLHIAWRLAIGVAVAIGAAR
jgi:hypothetical protein